MKISAWFAWFKNLFIPKSERTTMTDTQPVAPDVTSANSVAPAGAAVSAEPVQETPAVSVETLASVVSASTLVQDVAAAAQSAQQTWLDVTVLEKLLIALGHDVKGQVEHLVALATKAKE